MSLSAGDSLPRSSVEALPTHLGAIDDPRELRWVAHPSPEALLLVVSTTVCDRDDQDAIATGVWPLAVL